MKKLSIFAVTTTHPSAVSIRADGQRGQALAEFLALAVAIIPLFLLFPMIGKYQDLSHATLMASRYAAFDAANQIDSEGSAQWKAPAQLANEIRRRFYGNADAPIKTMEIARNVDADRNLFWHDPYGHPLIKNFSDVTVSFGAANAARQDAGFSAASDGSMFQFPFANAQQIGLTPHGIFTANASVNLANLPARIRSIAPFDKLDLSIQRHTSLVADQWDSPTTAVTEKRFGRLAPLNQVLDTFSPLVDAAIFVVDIGQVHGPKFGNLRPWRDVVQPDRLQLPYSKSK